MILKYGVWKKGQLVGKIGNKEPIMIEKDSPEAAVSFLFLGYVLMKVEVTVSGSQQLAAIPASEISVVAELDSKPRIPPNEWSTRYIDSDFSLDSEDSDNSEDLPPPYKV